jgi:hypothetical protein
MCEINWNSLEVHILFTLKMEFRLIERKNYDKIWYLFTATRFPSGDSGR